METKTEFELKQKGFLYGLLVGMVFLLMAVITIGIQLKGC